MSQIFKYPEGIHPAEHQEGRKIICTYLESPVFRLNHIPLNLSRPPELKNPFQIISSGPSAPFDEFQALEQCRQRKP